MSMYGVALTVALACGLAPAIYFTATFRPRHRFALLNLDAGAWPPVIGMLYAWIAVRNLFGLAHGPRYWWDGALTLAVLGLVDALLLVRAFHWKRVQREGHHPYLGPERRSADADAEA